MSLTKFIFLLGIVFSVFTKNVFAQTEANSLYLSYHQRLMISYLLAGAGATDIQKRQLVDHIKQEMIRHLSAPVEIIKVSSFADFLEHFRGPWPNSYSVLSDLQIIQSRAPVGLRKYQAETAELKLQIEEFLKNRDQELLKRARNSQILSTVTGATWNSILEFAQNRGFNLETNSSLSRYIDAWIMRSFDLAETLLTENFDKIKNIGAIDASTIAKLPPGITGFIIEILKEYFNRLSVASKKQIVNQLLGMELNAGQEEKFETMILNSGPEFQKLLQILAEESELPSKLTRLFKILESNVMPVPPELSEAIISKGIKTHNLVTFEKKPLGVGTLAQTHRAVMLGSRGPQQVAVRFLKPGIELRVEEDGRILREIAPLVDQNPSIKSLGLPKISPIVEDLHQTVIDELNLPGTMEHQAKGKIVYSQEILFKGKTYKTDLLLAVPDVLMPQASSELHVQELAHGTKLDELAEFYSPTIPDLKKVIVEAISKAWLQEALFGSGFFHSDLHQGNFLVEVSDNNIIVQFLDFGMGGNLHPTERANILGLSAGVELNRSDIISKALWGLSDKSRNEISWKELSFAVELRSQNIREGSLQEQTLEKWAAWASDIGLRYPSSFVGFNRGMTILSKSLKKSGSKDSISRIGKRLAVSNGGQVISQLRKEFNFDIKDLAILGWTAATKTSANENKRSSTLALMCHKAQSHAN